MVSYVMSSIETLTLICTLSISRFYTLTCIKVNYMS
jgi:hypothetical protein